MSARKIIRVYGRSEPVLDEFRVRGRTYFSLENLSRRGAFRVFDPHAGPRGDYRVLYRIPFSRATAQRLETFSRLAGPAAHANFPIITDCVRQNGDLFVVMTWVPGTSLRTLLNDVRRRAAPRPSVTVVCRLMRGLAHGIAQYHRHAQLVHGDICPANIIVSPKTTRLVLIDFGAAWPVERSATKNPGDGITLPYAAPERIGGHALEDFRSDLFSLCAVWYELLTLEIPFEGAGGQAGLPQYGDSFVSSYVPASRRIPNLRNIPPDSVDQLDELLRIGLALHPNGRFATTGQWLDAVDRIDIAFRALQPRSRWSDWWFSVFEWVEALRHLAR